MDIDKERIENERMQWIKKSNIMIQKSRYDLSLQEQKIILFLISKIKSGDTELPEVILTFKEFCDMFGIEPHGQNYANIKDKINTLLVKPFWIDIDGIEVGYHWLDTPTLERNKSIIRLKLHAPLKPYLLELRGNYTHYELVSVLAMSSRYSIRLYELLKSFAYQEEVILDLEMLKKKLEITKGYDVYNNFKVRILDKALVEINKYTDLQVSCEPVRTVRTITALHFKMRQLSDGDCTQKRVICSAKINGTNGN